MAHINKHQQPPRPLAGEEYLSTSELARRLGTTEGHLKSLRARGQGPHFVKFSDRCVRYPVSAVDEWIAEQDQQTRKEHNE